MKVLLVSGGRSVEREISIQSAGFVSGALRGAGHEVVEAVIGPDGSWTVERGRSTIEISDGTWKLLREGDPVPFDVLFPVLHGTYGEDGTVQGLCEMAGWKCAGAGVMASSVGMNKIVFKRLVSGAGIPVTRWVEVTRGLPIPSPSAIEGALGMPVFVKPARLGSSVGISRVDHPEQLRAALETALSHDELVLVEKAVDSPREIEVSVIGNGSEVHSSVPGEVVPGKSWYDYEAKYECGESRLMIPADLDPDTARAVRGFAVRSFELLGGRGFARVDFLLDGSDIFLNEINTIPGFTEISMFPKLWEASGLGSRQLMDEILREAVGRPAVGLWREKADG